MFNKIAEEFEKIFTGTKEEIREDITFIKKRLEALENHVFAQPGQIAPQPSNTEETPSQ